MKTTKNITRFVLTVIMVGIFSTVSMAQDKPCSKTEPQASASSCSSGCGFGYIKDLSLDQKKQIKTLKLKLVKETLNTKNLIEEKKAHLTTISTGDNVDMIAINKTIDELFALKAEIAKKKMVFYQEVRKLLTDDQKLMFDVHHSAGDKFDNGYHQGGKCSGQSQGCNATGGEQCCKTQGQASGCGTQKSCAGSGDGKSCCKTQGQSAGCGTQKSCAGAGDGKSCCKGSGNATGASCQTKSAGSGCGKGIGEAGAKPKCCKSGNPSTEIKN